MKNLAWVTALVVGFLIGLSISLTIRPAESEFFQYCEERIILCEKKLLVPTATPHACPPLPDPCPTVTYKMLPDVTRVLSDLGLVDYEMALVDTKLENYIGSTEGEYDWNLVGILSLHRSSHNYLLEAADEVINWYNLGYMTCEGGE